MKLPVNNVLSICTLFTGLLGLTAATPENRRPWNFKAHHFYDSKLQLADCSADVNIPMVFNKESDQLIRVIPYDTLDKSKSLVDEKELQEAEQYGADKNLVQIFPADLSRVHTKFVGPCECPIQDLGIFYKTEVDSSSSSSSSTGPSVKAYLGAGCPSTVTLFKYPCLTQKCQYNNNQTVVKTITTSEGLTYILFNDHMDVIDDCCTVVRSLPSFDYAQQTWTTAVDFVLDERNTKMAIAFEGFYYVVIDYKSFTYYYSQYMFGSPTTLPFRLFPSGMILPGVFYFRFYYDDSTYYCWSILYDCKSCLETTAKPSPSGGYLPDSPDTKSVQGGGPAYCNPNIDYPAFIPDYVNQIDILVGRADPFCDHILVYVSKAVCYNDIARQCQEDRIPKQVSGTIIVYTNTKVADENVFYIGFTRSLDILQIKYAPA